MTEITQEQYQKFFDEFEKVYKEYENKVKERRARGIHDYNVFDVLETKEVKHSKFIASLLDPKGLHYQGDLFLREFVKICVSNDFEFDTSRAKVYIEYGDTKGRYGDTKGRIDIYITDDNKHIIIENKICNANDQDKQIYRYIETIKKENLSLDNDGILVLYLTPNDGKTPSKESLNGFKIKDGFLEKDNDKIRYKHIVCNHILEWLNKVKNEIVNLTDLNVIITQYEKAVKNLINKGEKMENNLIIEQIKENYKLCAVIDDNLESAETELINNFFEEVYRGLNDNLEIQNNWTLLPFNKIENEKKDIRVIEITPKELEYHKYIRFVVERKKKNEILYGFLKNNVEIKLENIQPKDEKDEWYHEWYLVGDFAFESMKPREFILKNIKNENGVEEAVKDYVNKILSDIKKSKDKLKEINDKINGYKQ
ncbi:MAG: PD-(D/E)XK nuclease family protein [Campylobacter sp.]|uniref:PDDEXK-like family protein n=1 Tax=Campylobacter sp. TaxID=205 RepID=UPI002AA64F0D|nr:PD-(D/E)XK nuclease family protein [Campylobacter sp.]MCI7549696.1 PD-(D/E)XK nuclease family protein [Campylobacter sp.]